MKGRHLSALSVLLAVTLLPLFSASAAQVKYNAIVTRLYPNSFTRVYEAPDEDAKGLVAYMPGKKLQILEVYPGWVAVAYGSGVGYVMRHRVAEVTPVDPVGTAPYGVEVYRYFATCTQDTPVLSESGETLITLSAGAQVAFIGIDKGMAKLVFKRQYGYIDTRLLDNLQMTAPDASRGTSDTPIAVFTSFYNIKTNWENVNRMGNLAVGCARMERVMQPGDLLDFNNSVGRFTAANGYLPAPVLIDGETKIGYGGGSCQISSTLYNTVLQLQGITVVERHPHGANGASYLPHGMDASSGDLNFRIRNDYAFPISIKTHVQDGALFIAIYKEGA